MDTTLTFDASQLTAYAGRLDGAGGVLARESQVAMQRVTIAGQGFAREVTPVDTGLLRNAWAQTATPTLGRIFNSQSYATVVDQGRRAGAPMPPAGVLLGWMGRHGIPAEAEFPVRRAIGRRGIPPRRMVEQTMARLRPLVDTEFRAAIARFIAALRA